MKRRAQRPQPGSNAAAHNHSANHSRALVRVDGTGIRKKIKKDYEKALRDLEKSRRQLDQFHQTDLPQFKSWLSTHFGALLTELNELSRKMAADEELIFQVESEAMFAGCSDARAYQRVMELRENPEPPPAGPAAGGGEAEEERGPFGSRPEPGTGEDEEESAEEFMDEFFRAFGSDRRPQDHHAPRNGQPAKSAEPTHASKRLKELYRAVARQLHPDSQREMTAQKTEWWHQAQAAYEEGDAEQLQVILTLVEIGDSGTTAHTSASLLQRITAQLKNSLRQIKRQITSQKRDPAWNFSGRANHDALEVRTRRALLADLEGMRSQHRFFQEIIAKWKASAERLKKPRRPKNNKQNMVFSL